MKASLLSRKLFLDIVLAGTLVNAMWCFSTAEQRRVDVCDVSFLWPLPVTSDDAAMLVSIDEKLTVEGTSICPPDAFKEVMGHAEAMRLIDPVSSEEIRIDLHDAAFKQITTWKIAGIRFDPSAPGCSSAIRIDQKLGSTAQIRLICQPVTTTAEDAIAHDFAIHLVFSYVTNRTRPFQADQVRFGKIIEDLLTLKGELRDKGLDTTGKPLGVHPGFSLAEIDLTAKLRVLLKENLSSRRLTAIAFMGLQSRAEPWVFFATQKMENGKFEVVENHPSLLSSRGQALSFVTRSKIFPSPSNHQFGSVGVDTSSLFSVGNIDRRALPDSESVLLNSIKVKDIPDIIANPNRSHFFTTDCISCHTESSLRASKLSGHESEFAFVLPEGMSGVDPSTLPVDDATFSNWNVRNFGWGFKAFNKMTPTVTMRTANEAAESAEFINQTYLTQTPDRGDTTVANPLTLVIKCRDDDSFKQLKGKIESMLRSDQNPIKKALDSLGNVHFARFVFLDKSNELAVITVYDGDFETYIHRFVDEIGDIFNLILDHAKDVEAMQGDDGKVDVQSHREEFVEFVKKNDLGATEPFYSAYPKLSVQQILELQRKALE